MLKLKWSESLEKLIKQRNAFLVLSLGMMLANILTASLLFFKNERIVIVPAYFKQTFWTEGELVSDSYIEEMSLFFTKLMLDTTPDSHKYRRDVILRYVAPKYYHELEKKLIAEAERLYKEGVTTSFMPKEVKVKALGAEVTGLLISYISGTRVGEVKETYQLQFGNTGGIFMLENFTVKKESNE